MTPKCILFDLDGTLTDSGPGILGCARETFIHYGIPLPDDAAMQTMVGPPLRASFLRFGFTEDQVEEAIVHYRRLYVDHGIFNNTPYPGILPLVQRLAADGHRLFVATSKPEHMAVAIMEHFGLAPYFECVCGALMDGIRDKKEMVIEYLLEKAGHTAQLVMVGDTVFDVLGAKVHNIPTVAVSWGYGSSDEMMAAGAVALAHDAEELYSLLK